MLHKVEFRYMMPESWVGPNIKMLYINLCADSCLLNIIDCVSLILTKKKVMFMSFILISPKEKAERLCCIILIVIYLVQGQHMSV